MTDTTTVIGAKNKLLDVFLGKWNTKGEVAATASTPRITINATDTYEWLPGGYALAHYTDAMMGDDKVEGIEIISYDALRQAYFASFFDNQGSVGWEEIHVEGNTWTWHGKDVMGVPYHRCTMVFSDDGATATARHEQSADDKSWQLWMNVTLTK